MDEKDILRIYDYVMIDGKPKTNRFRIKKFDNGSVAMDFYKGRNRETGYKKQMAMWMSKSDVQKLRDWLNIAYPD